MSGKSEQRKSGRRARLSLTPDERTQYSLDIAEHIFSSNLMLRVRHVGCYLPTDEEVNTWPLIERAWRMKKRIFVPVLKKKRRMDFVEIDSGTPLGSNWYGLDEPGAGKKIPACRLDIVLMPLVAFDRTGNRIGMGGGYFDREFAFLKHRRKYRRPKLIGLAFSCQKVGSVCASPWDVPLFQVYSENGAELHR